mmetsp:Transcript_23495/g.51062  ORF Transcript_23495/g.51062 Transcript_23495/m.51062 type:complete len:279 (-) Transcript_23495:26-862(-)
MSFTQFTAMPVMLTYCTRLVGAKITETASEDQHAEQEGAAEDQTADKETPEKPMKVMVTVALNTWLPLGTSDLCANSGLSTESTCSGGESIRAMVVDVINGPSQGQGVTTGLNVDPALDQGNRTRWAGTNPHLTIDAHNADTSLPVVRLVHSQGRSETLRAPPQHRIRDVFPRTLSVFSCGKRLDPNTLMTSTPLLLTCCARLVGGMDSRLGKESAHSEAMEVVETQATRSTRQKRKDAEEPTSTVDDRQRQRTRRDASALKGSTESKGKRRAVGFCP